MPCSMLIALAPSCLPEACVKITNLIPLSFARGSKADAQQPLLAAANEQQQNTAGPVQEKTQRP